jgi:hypothetical protein
MIRAVSQYAFGLARALNESAVMSIKIMSVVWDIEFPTATRLLIALKLADYSNDEGRSIYPSKPTLASKAQCDQRTVERTLAAFRKCGLIAVVREGGGRGNTTEYKLDLRLLEKLRTGAAHFEGNSRKFTLVDKPRSDAGVSETPVQASQNPRYTDRGTHQ